MSFISFWLGQAILSWRDLGSSLSQPHVLRAVIGAGLFVAVSGPLGLGLGTGLLRLRCSRSRGRAAALAGTRRLNAAAGSKRSATRSRICGLRVRRESLRLNGAVAPRRLGLAVLVFRPVRIEFRLETLFPVSAEKGSPTLKLEPKPRFRGDGRQIRDGIRL